MFHVNNKFVKAGNQGGELVAKCFSNLLNIFFDEAKLTPKVRLRER